jgi:hypothetical protein
MTSTNGGLEIFKTDARGHIRMPVERREALLDEFEKSGLSGAKFARLAGIHYGTFATWAQRRRKERAASGTAPGSGPVRLIEATVEGATRTETGSMADAGGLVIELPGGGRVRVESPMQLRLAAELLSMMAAGMNQNAPRRC